MPEEDRELVVGLLRRHELLIHLAKRLIHELMLFNSFFHVHSKVLRCRLLCLILFWQDTDEIYHFWQD